ncbi:MAG: Ig-like domain-containing protein [Bacteroidota bacterium]
MKTALHLLSFCLLLSLTACIGDDFIDDSVDPEVRITNTIDSLQIGTDFAFEVTFLDNVGRVDDDVPVTWTSSDPEIISVTSFGVATALASGSATLTATAEFQSETYHEDFLVHVGESTTTIMEEDERRVGTIRTTSSYRLEGMFEMTTSDDGLLIEVDDTYITTSALPGFYLYLSNNPNSIANAIEIGEVTVFEGAHTYTVQGDGLGLDTYGYLLYYCKPFNIKVGDGKIEKPE